MALGARIFGHEEDMKLAARLTESCVWAYGSTSSGIMPEEFRLLECPEEGGCAWNQTYWYHALDPSWNTRDQQIEMWEMNEEIRHKKEAEEEAQRLESEAENANVLQSDNTELRDASNAASAQPSALRRRSALDMRQEPEDIISDVDIPDVVPHGIDFASTNHKSTASGHIVPDDPPGGPILPSKVITAPPPQNGEIQNGASQNGAPQNGPYTTGGSRPLPYPARPPTHEEYVERKIRSERLYPGVLGHNRKEYILR